MPLWWCCRGDAALVVLPRWWGCCGGAAAAIAAAEIVAVCNEAGCPAKASAAQPTAQGAASFVKKNVVENDKLGNGIRAPRHLP